MAIFAKRALSNLDIMVKENEGMRANLYLNDGILELKKCTKFRKPLWLKYYFKMQTVKITYSR